MASTMRIKSGAASRKIVPVGVGLAMLFVCLQAYSQGSAGRKRGQDRGRWSSRWRI
jgi:hypothetical protein